MKTQFTFTSDAFAPRPGELDEAHDDYINPGLYALELADFLVAGLAGKGFEVGFRCQEDWGHWMELVHDGGYTLALGCSNTESTVGGKPEHRVFVTPDKPVIRKLFRKIDVRADVERLVDALGRILAESPQIDGVTLEAP